MKKNPKTKTQKKAKALEAKKPERPDLPDRKLIEGARALVLKRGRLEINADQCVYETENAYCLWDKTTRKRTAWIRKGRIKQVDTGGNGK